MTTGILKEPQGENRVSMLPEIAGQLRKMNQKVMVESGAGLAAFASDSDYEHYDITVASREEVIRSADVILSIHQPEENLTNKVMIGVYQPLFHFKKVEEWAKSNNTIFSMDVLPRTTRAQSMDVLSSQANIAGYKAVLLAATEYCRYFPMFMTAAGSIAPAKVLILGAGVAGLQAIATAKRLGAVVEVFDTRPAVKEEVQSLGAKFVEVEGAADASKAGGYAVEQSEEYKQKQQQKIAESVAKADIIITTAQIPGKKAPILITDEMLNRMRAGSVVVDLAAATGGNTNYTKNNEIVMINGVKIIGNSNLQCNQPSDASKLYGKNIFNFLKLIIDKEGNLYLNFEDDLVKETCIAHGGNITNERIKALISTSN
ncbi:MAG: Re/Si-specific NAD(P)(+) transhydrogenase subunit alpha [Chitinophagaceae bacterium]|nr:MAG: NAD(P)(+) transhydrogenase [Bacteroidetes bacterium OLB11]MCC6447367.1 Re/Si-specific NAD(P)(+) transhydrogenase subunit alpha [Chitinophagaceae bacterium]HMN33027.1 Re/Si-specific NAD(P)(+) transhydrogenase subunit alpha [Chitinophagaceae bacterium]